MANTFGNSYGLTTLCPIINGIDIREIDGSRQQIAYDKITRQRLQQLGLHQNSPFAQVPNTYFARLFILNDVFFQQGNEVKQDQLKSKYLVFTSNFHGELEPYLTDMWHNAQQHIRQIWQYAVGFHQVSDAQSFIAYIKKCQLTTSLFFNGSSDESLKQQLKSLYIKQAFTEFTLEHQHKQAGELKAAFRQFIAEVQLDNLNQPSWLPGQTSLA